MTHVNIVGCQILNRWIPSPRLRLLYLGWIYGERVGVWLRFQYWWRWRSIGTNATTTGGTQWAKRMWTSKGEIVRAEDWVQNGRLRWWRWCRAWWPYVTRQPPSTLDYIVVQTHRRYSVPWSTKMWPSAGTIMSLYPSILSGSCYHFSKICQVPIGACQMEELTRQRQVKDWSQCFDDYGSIDEKEKDKDVRRSHGSESQVPDTELFTKRLRVFICQKLKRENTSSLLLFSSDHDDTTITFSTLDWDSVQHYIETTKNVWCRTLHPLMTESRIHELERDFLLWVIIQRHRHRHCRLALRWNVIRFSLRIPNVRIWRMIFFRR